MARPEFWDGQVKQVKVVSAVSADCWLHPPRGEQNGKDRDQAGEISKLVNVNKIGLEQWAEPEQISERQNKQHVWRASVLHRYPDLHRKTYIVPPVQFSRVRYSKLQMEDDVIQVPQPDGQLSDVRDNESRRRIHNAMTSMFEGKDEVMFVCFAMQFDNYLNYGGKTKGKVRQKRKRSSHNRGQENEVVLTKRFSRTLSDCGSATQNGDHVSSIHPGASNTLNQVTSPTPSCDLSIFPRPRDLSMSYRRGEFDVLVIHRNFGLMVAEIKAVGDVFQVVGNGMTLGEQQHIICRGVGKLLKQLDKNVEVLNYLLTDIVLERVDKGVDSIPITKAVMLPNLSRQSLAAALRQEPALEQAFCQCLGDGSLDVALKRCIFSEQLPPIGHSLDAEHDVIKELYSDWWKPLMHKTSCSPMDASLYESIVARFCGPATKQYVVTATNPRAEVSTLSQAVVETARCFTSQQILTEQQVAMLEEASPRVIVSGPPGTGKAVMLMLKMKEWLRQGHHVLLVSLWMASHALSCHIFNKDDDDGDTCDAHPHHPPPPGAAGPTAVITALLEGLWKQWDKEPADFLPTRHVPLGLLSTYLAHRLPLSLLTLLSVCSPGAQYTALRLILWPPSPWNTPRQRTPLLVARSLDPGRVSREVQGRSQRCVTSGASLVTWTLTSFVTSFHREWLVGLYSHSH